LTFLVTGGSGFIGSNLVDYLLEQCPDDRVINYSRHTYAFNPRILSHREGDPRYSFVSGDVCDALLLNRVVRENHVSAIFHLAASTHVDRSFLYPEEFLRNNVVGTFTILEVVRHMPEEERPKVVYVSTDEVFGDVPPPRLCKEDDSPSPRNPYSASKASCEMYCQAYYHSFGIPVLISRSMNNFGPRQHSEKLIAKIITRCLSDTPFTLYEGGSTRGWIYVWDTCDAIHTILERGRVGWIYHIPPTVYRTVPEVVEAILELTGKEHLFQGYKGRRLKDDERYALDGSRMRDELGWSPKIGFEDALKDTVEWYEENRWFWEGVSAP